MERWNGFYVVIETQARGALHIHFIMYGGLGPTLVEKVACTIAYRNNPTTSNRERLCLAVQRALDPAMNDAILR